MPALSSVAMASGGIVVLENRRGSAQTSGAVPRPSSHRARRCNQGHVRQAGGNSRLKLRRRRCGLGGKLSGVRARRRTRSTAWRIVLRPERRDSPAPSARRSTFPSHSRTEQYSFGLRAAVVPRLMVRPVYPQLRNCRMRRGSYAWCQKRSSGRGHRDGSAHGASWRALSCDAVAVSGGRVN